MKRILKINNEFSPILLGNLRAHVRRLHVVSREQQGDVHRCDDCNAVFRNVSSLTSHMSKFHCDQSIPVRFMSLLSRFNR